MELKPCMIVARHLTVRGYGLQICTLSIKIDGYMATASNLRRHTVGWSTATGYGADGAIGGG